MSPAIGISHALQDLLANFCWIVLLEVAKRCQRLATNLIVWALLLLVVIQHPTVDAFRVLVALQDLAP
jgi:hypothetical protein